MKISHYITLLLCCFFLSCNSSAKKEIIDDEKNLGTIITGTNYKIAVLPIDSISFYQATDLAIRARNKVISHPNQIKKELPQSVFLKANTYNDLYLSQINFTEGGIYHEEDDQAFIKNYYPELSILTCEQCH